MGNGDARNFVLALVLLATMICAGSGIVALVIFAAVGLLW